MRRTPVLIVGGGPAGAAAAILLARAGLRPLLVERGGKDRIVCGGFLGWDALPTLAGLGVDVRALGARPIGCVRFLAGQRVVETGLPGPAAGLSRARLDEALLALAEQEGAEIIRGIAVRRVEDKTAFLGDGSVIEAESLILATGKHSLRGAERVGMRGDGHVGLRATIVDPSPHLAGAIELHLFAGGYAGLLVQEDGSANLCLSVSAGRFREAGGSALALADAIRDEAPTLARLIAEADPAWSAIAAIPYGWRARATETGRLRIGDQAGVIASLVGDGIAMALASGIAAANALIAGETTATFQRALATRNATPIRIAELARRSAERPGLARMMLPILARAPGLVRLVANATRVA